MTTPEKDYNATFKVLVLGESGVGKTSIIRRFTEGQFHNSYISTIGIDSRSKVVTVGDEKVRLQIWDTAGQERFRTLTSAYYRGAMGIILVYDVTSEYTFSNISNWMDTIENNASKDTCRLLIGNKIDADADEIVISSKRGAERAKQSNLEFFETSAKEGIQVNEAFMAMAELIFQHKKQRIEDMKEPSIVLRQESQPSGRCC